MLLTGATAVLYFDSLRLGKCRDISLAVDREALPTTKQGDIDRTFISGLRDTKGSASLFFDSTDPAVEALLTRLFNDAGTLSGVELVFDTSTDDKVSAPVALTNATISTSFGSATVCDVQFQFSGKPVTKYQLNPPVPPQPPSSVAKWLAYTTANETYVEAPSITLDSQGNTYAFIAGDNGASTEVTKFSPIGTVLWIRKVTSYVGQPQYGNRNGPDNRRVNLGQSLHLINDNAILLCLFDRASQTSLILINGQGDVIYNRAYLMSNGQTIRVLNRLKTKFVITDETTNYIRPANVTIFDIASGSCITRFSLNGFANEYAGTIQNAIERPDGNWVLYLRTHLAPYARYFVELNSSLTSVTQAVTYIDLITSPRFCVRPETGGYLVAGVNGSILELDSSFNLVESRSFPSGPSSIVPDSNGDYIISNWTADLGGLPGFSNLFAFTKYNWDGDYVYYVTIGGTGNSLTADVNTALQRVSLAPIGTPIGIQPPPYRQVCSMNLVQSQASSGLPIYSDPPVHGFAARTVLSPAARPTVQQIAYSETRLVPNVSTLTLLTERPSTFIVEPANRLYGLVFTSN